MRIISGRFKGKVIKAPAKLPVRPTTDQAKEGLFNILHNWYDFEDLRILDLFAGTGNVSYEFWSRGVGEVTSVDRHPGCIKFIRMQFKEMEVKGQVVKSDSQKFLTTATGKWDIIFMDPPYALEGMERLVEVIFERELLSAHGVVILEHPVQKSYREVNRFNEERRYGGSVFSVFE